MKKLFKIFVWLISILIVFGIITFGLIPYILSSKSGKRSILSQLESIYGGKYVIEELSLKWYGLQKATNIRILQENQIITAKEASLRMSLLKIFTMRKYPLELIFSGELQVKDAKILLSDNTSLTNVNFIANNENRTMVITGDTSTSLKEKGSFTMQGTEGAPWDWSGTLTNFPSQIIELFYPKFHARSLIGNNFKAIFTYTNSYINLDFSSALLDFQTEGELTATKFLLGNQTTVHYILNKNASDTFFSDLSVRPISSQKIKAVIEPKNAHFTYNPFKVESIMIDSLTLDLGKMIFRNFGAVSDLLSLIKLQIRPNTDVPLWFQEMPISVNSGVASVTRSEILIDNSYEVGLWGNVDFAKSEVSLYLGLSAQLLRKVFKLKSIGPTYTIPVQVDGKFGNVKLNKAKALREIGKVIIVEQAQLPILPMPTTKAPAPRPPYPWNK